MRSQGEIIEDIKYILEEKVAPSVAQHNGAIGFIDFTSSIILVESSSMILLEPSNKF